MTLVDDRKAFTFEAHVWNDFDAERVIEALISDDQTVFARQQILFEALSTWCIAPKREQKIYRYAIANKVFAAAVAVERKATKRNQRVTFPFVDADKLRSKDQKFLTDIYAQIGGLRTIGATANGITLRALVRQKVKTLVPVLRVLTLFHTYYEIAPKSRFKATQQKCMEFLAYNTVDTPGILSVFLPDERYKRPVRHSERNIQGAFSDLRVSACLLYSASHIADDKGTLIAAIVNRESDRFSRFRPHLSDWFGKALYVYENILPERHQNIGFPWQCPVTRDHVEPLPFPASELPDDQVAKMLKEFSEAPAI